MLTKTLSNCFSRTEFTRKIIAGALLLATSLLWCSILVSCSQEGDQDDIAVDFGTRFTLLVHTYNVNGKTFILPGKDMNQLCASLNERAHHLEISGFLAKPLQNNKIAALFDCTERELCSKHIAAILSDEVDIKFLPVHPENGSLTAEGVEHIPGWQPYEYEYEDHMGVLQQSKLFLSERVELTVMDIKNATVDYSRHGYVNVTFNDGGANKMQRITSAMKKGMDRMAVVIDGRVTMAPVVQSNLSKDISISGLDGHREAEKLVNRLANKIPYVIEVIDEQASE